MKTILLIMALSLFTIPAMAADNLCFQWDYSAEDQSVISGFRLLKDTHTNVIMDNIAPDQRSVCIPDPKDPENHNYFLVAFSADDVSGNSDIAVYKHTLVDPAPAKTLVPVGQFLLTIEQVQ